MLGQTVTSGIKNNYLEAFRRIGRQRTPKDPKRSWVQFKNEIIDLETDEKIAATPEYFVVNPIDWKLGPNGDTPVIDQLFEDWQGNNKEVLYEILSYCLVSDYPIHAIITFIGSGRNGKSQFLKVIQRFIGQENITSTELDNLIDNRFESAKLHKKLVCTMGETNFGVINKTSLLKKLCGGDLIGYEFKNKMPFTDQNYAKIIISTNSLPPSNDTTEGFYRRWLILNWNACFEEGKDIINIIPESEYEHLAYKCVGVLKALLARGSFTGQGSIAERKQKYVEASNPLIIFIETCCEVGEPYVYFVKSKDLYHAYIQYLGFQKRRTIKRKEFLQILSEEGYQPDRKEKKVGDGVYENSYWIEGLRLKADWLVSAQNAQSAWYYHSISLHGETKVKSWSERALCADKGDAILLPCSYCGAPPPCYFTDAKGRPVCEFCEETLRSNGLITKQ